MVAGAAVWALRTFVLTGAVGLGLLLADWSRPAAMNAPAAASFPAHLQVAAPATTEPTARPAATTPFPTEGPDATPAQAPSLAPPIATAAPVLSVPLANVPQTLRVKGMELTLIVAPGVAGPNDLDLFFFDAAGAWASVTAVEFRVQLLGSPSPPMVFSVDPLHPGHAFVADSPLRHAGVWRVEVRLDSTEVPGIIAGFEFLLP